MAQAAGAVAGIEASKAASELAGRAMQALDTELFGYHHEDLIYDSKNRLKEVKEWNVSIRGWEAAGLLLVIAAWEVGQEITAALKGTDTAATLLGSLVPGGNLAVWGVEALGKWQKGESPSAPEGGTFMQTLSVHGTFYMNSLFSIVNPIIVPLLNQLADQIKNQTKQSKEVQDKAKQAMDQAAQSQAAGFSNATVYAKPPQPMTGSA